MPENTAPDQPENAQDPQTGGAGSTVGGVDGTTAAHAADPTTHAAGPSAADAGQAPASGAPQDRFQQAPAADRFQARARQAPTQQVQDQGWQTRRFEPDSPAPEASVAGAAGGAASQSQQQAGAYQTTSPRQPGNRPADYAQEPGFFKALFDLRFQHYITVKFAAVIYVLALLAYAAVWLIAIIGLAAGGYTKTSVLVLLLGAVVFLVQAVFLRVVLEFFTASIRTAQNTTLLVKQGELSRR